MGANLPDAVYRACSESASTPSSPDVAFSSKQRRNVRPYSLKSQDPHPQEPQDRREVEIDTSNRNPRDLFSAFSPAYFSPAVPRYFRAIWARHGGTTLQPPLAEPDVPPPPWGNPFPQPHAHTDADSPLYLHSYLPETGGTGVYTHPLILPFKVFFVYPPNDPVERALSGACVWPWDVRWVEACARVGRAVDTLEYVLEHRVEGRVEGVADDGQDEEEEDEIEEVEEEEVEESGQDSEPEEEEGRNGFGLREDAGQLGALDKALNEHMLEFAPEGREGTERELVSSSLAPREVALAPLIASSKAAPSTPPSKSSHRQVDEFGFASAFAAPHRGVENSNPTDNLGAQGPESNLPPKLGLGSSVDRNHSPVKTPGTTSRSSRSSSGSSSGGTSSRLDTPTISPTLILRLWDKAIADNGLEDLLPSSFDLQGLPPYDNTAFLVLGKGAGGMAQPKSRETGYDEEEVRTGGQEREDSSALASASASAVPGATKRKREGDEDQGNQEDHEGLGNGHTRENRGDDEILGDTQQHDTVKEHEHIGDYGKNKTDAEATESTRPYSRLGLDVDFNIEIDMLRHGPEREQPEHPADTRLRDLERKIWERKSSAGIVCPSTTTTTAPIALGPSFSERKRRGGAGGWASMGFERSLERKRPIDDKLLANTGTGRRGEGHILVAEKGQRRLSAARNRKTSQRLGLVSRDSSDEYSTPGPKPRFPMERITEEEETGQGLERRDGHSQTTKIGEEHYRPADGGDGDQDTQSSRPGPSKGSKPSKPRTKIKRESGPPWWKREEKRLSRRTSIAFPGA